MSPSQSDFLYALRDGAAPVPENLTDGHKRPAGRRFDVYRNNVAVSLRDALRDSFPALLGLLGESNFNALALTFQSSHPPASPLMMYYGAEMPTFLASFPPLASRGYLSDVARLELALRRAYHAADVGPLAPERLQRLSPAQLATARFSLAPAVEVIRSPWPLHSIHRYATQQGAPKPTATPECVLITRPNYDPKADPISTADATFLETLCANATLGEAANLAQSEDAGFDLTPLLQLLLKREALAELHLT